jgi:MHS family proline/betaine transporter-like MFS transporter
MIRFKAILSAVIGTLLEHYDAMLYVHFLFILSPLFFPNEDPFITALLGMLSFAVGFVTRPLGGIFFGHIGDRLGRRVALGLSVMFVSIPTFIMGILPTYAQIGIAAPIILVICRMLQSFCVGGEATGASVFLAEHAAPGRQCLTSSLLNVSINIGSLMGAGIGLISLNSFFPEWGWRIPFLMGAFFCWFGYYIRTKVGETPAFQNVLKEHKVANIPLMEVLKSDKIVILRTMGICAGVMAPYQMIYVYMGDVLRNKLQLPMTEVLAHNMKIMVILIFSLLFMGYLGDKFGFKKVMGGSLLAIICITYPLFWFIEGTTSPNDVMLMQAILAFIGSGVSASCCLMSTFFPTKERYSGYSFGWALGSIFFAGFTPLLSLLLVKWTGNETAPAFILMFCGFLGIVALTTSKKRYDEREDIEALPKFVNWPKPMRTA